MKKLSLTASAILMLALPCHSPNAKDMQGAQANPASQTISGAQWKHVKTLNTSTRHDVSAAYANFSGYALYKPDGTYDFLDEHGVSRGDRGTWSLSNDGNRLTLVSLTFEYSKDLVVTLVDENNLEIQTNQYDRDGRTKETVTEVFASIRKKITLVGG